MTTAGGGWVLIGRGRQDWTFDWAGQGTSAAVRGITNGPGAFAPAALPSTRVNALLNGRSVESLTDGIRLRRATDTNGTGWQEIQLHTASMRAFTWEFNGGQPLKSVQFNSAPTKQVGPTGDWRKQSTYNLALDNTYRRVFTGPVAYNHNRAGFTYGRTVRGSTSPKSYMWSQHNNGLYAVPFTQVFLRPKISDANVGFAPIRSTGTAAATIARIPSSIPQTMTWGVRGVQIDSTDPDPLGQSPVYGLAQIGNTMYVGGKFHWVEHHNTGGLVNQPWLAAFDMNTGAWQPGFHPSLDGAVFDLKSTPDGRLIVGGNFTNVNGVTDTAGLAILDPTTGAPTPGWSATVANSRFGSTRPYVRTIEVNGNDIYIGGSFSKITGGPGATMVAVGGVGRVSLTDGTPDTNWRVYTDGTPMDLASSANPGQIHLAGFFKNVGTTNANMTSNIAIVTLNTSDGAVVPLPAPHFWGGLDQYAVTEYNGAIFHGGQQKWLARYDAGFNFTRGVQMWPHGDIQALEVVDGVLFGGCHCNGFSIVDPTMTHADGISWVGAWDPANLNRNLNFHPQWVMNTSAEGGWELLGDTAGCLWVGADVIQGARPTDWLGGFARFCPPDTTAPSQPSRRGAKSGPRIFWIGSTDDSHVAPNYEILRNDRVIAVVSSTTRSYNVPGRGHYFVRAIDRAGNRSASTSVYLR